MCHYEWGRQFASIVPRNETLYDASGNPTRRAFELINRAVANREVML